MATTKQIEAMVRGMGIAREIRVRPEMVEVDPRNRVRCCDVDEDFAEDYRREMHATFTKAAARAGIRIEIDVDEKGWVVVYPAR